jgi:AbrB family looped-hinge helix DNA binding protein
MAESDSETTVNGSYSVTVPADVRDRVDLEPGDKLRWSVDDDSRLVAEVVRERYGAFEDADPIDIGEETDAVEDTEFMAYEID